MDTGKHKVIKKISGNKNGEILIESIVSFIIFIIVLIGVTALVLSSANMNKEADISNRDLENEIKAAENDTAPITGTGTMTIVFDGNTFYENINIKKQTAITYFSPKNDQKTTHQLGEETMASIAQKFTKARAGSLPQTDGAFTGERIDGIDASDPNAGAGFAFAVYTALTTEQKSFADSISWSIVNTENGYYIFFVAGRHYTSLEDDSGIKVYKYDMKSTKYQYTGAGSVDDGRVSSSGSGWSSWNTTVLEWQ
jgi:hypothetical protein